MSAVLEQEAETDPVIDSDSIVIQFAGDSGDGMQLVGTQFSNASALYGNDISTFPDFPAEIRAPAGTTAGVSGFQVHFSNHDIKTPGDQVHALVAMNPAALKTNIQKLLPGGYLIVNSDAFTENDLRKAGYTSNPLEGDGLREYIVIRAPMTKLNRDAVKKTPTMGTKVVDRCKNFFALGMLYWIYDRPIDTTLRWVDQKFGKNREICEANKAALLAGLHFGETLELVRGRVRVAPARDTLPGVYRQIMGNQALAMGLATAGRLANKDVFYASYPITPASDILHELSRLKNYRVRTFQAEDEIAAITSALGASFGGALAVTGTSGPGLALKTEAVGLAVMTELPLVIVDVQRGGPSTGLPTKTEQADLLQAVCGRNGECPVAVVAPATPGDCFYVAQEACRIAIEFMTPVIILSDGYIANSAEPWLVPNASDFKPIEVRHPEADGSEFQPYARNEKLARPWAIPGTPGLQHRIGGLEKADITGDINYEPENHQHMINTRKAKIDGIARYVPLQTVEGPESGELLVVSWGGTFGSVSTACANARRDGQSVAHCHLRNLHPFPSNLGDILKRYKRVLVPELNMGQLLLLLRGRYLVDARGFNKVKGQPFWIAELRDAINQALAS